MATKESFKDALRAMLEDGEFDRIAKAYPDKADRVLELRDALARAEEQVDNNLGKGIGGLSIAMLLGILADDEPVCTGAVCYMMELEGGAR